RLGQHLGRVGLVLRLRLVLAVGFVLGLRLVFRRLGLRLREQFGLRLLLGRLLADQQRIGDGGLLFIAPQQPPPPCLYLHAPPGLAFPSMRSVAGCPLARPYLSARSFSLTFSATKSSIFCSAL